MTCILSQKISLQVIFLMRQTKLFRVYLAKVWLDYQKVFELVANSTQNQNLVILTYQNNNKKEDLVILLCDKSYTNHNFFFIILSLDEL